MKLCLHIVCLQASKFALIFYVPDSLRVLLSRALICQSYILYACGCGLACAPFKQPNDDLLLSVRNVVVILYWCIWLLDWFDTVILFFWQYLTSTSCCSSVPPSLASWPALLFPCTPQWEGIHGQVTLRLFLSPVFNVCGTDTIFWSGVAGVPTLGLPWTQSVCNNYWNLVICLLLAWVPGFQH